MPAWLSPGLCTTTTSFMLQQTIQLVPQHLIQLAAPGSLAVLRANLVSPASMAAEAVARVGSNKTCTGSPGCLGWPGWPGRSRIAGGGNVGWSIMGTVRHPDLWNAKKTVHFLSLGNNKPNDVDESTNFFGVTKVLGSFSNLNTTNSKVLHMGQFLQGGKNGRLMSFFFKVEPPCDQT